MDWTIFITIASAFGVSQVGSETLGTMEDRGSWKLCTRQKALQMQGSWKLTEVAPDQREQSVRAPSRWAVVMFACMMWHGRERASMATRLGRVPHSSWVFLGDLGQIHGCGVWHGREPAFVRRIE
eukprot:366400-Chlamydomonas_euryale.AAC.15